MGLPRGLGVQGLDLPLAAAHLAGRVVRPGELFQRAEIPHPEELPLERAENAPEAAVAPGFAHEGGRGAGAPHPVGLRGDDGAFVALCLKRLRLLFRRQ